MLHLSVNHTTRINNLVEHSLFSTALPADHVDGHYYSDAVVLSTNHPKNLQFEPA